MLNLQTKKGEMTTQQIVILVILIISFAVLLYFLFRLNLGNETESDVCHNSVVARGSSVIPTEGVPLQCSRKYVCITSDGSCEEMTQPDKKSVKTKVDVYNVLANEMADCWWMFGEGKVNYVGTDMLPQLYCSICSQIAFDNSLEDKKIFGGKEFDKREFYQHLAITNMSNSEQTYAEYLFGTKDIDSLSETKAGKLQFNKVNFDNQYYVLMGITSDVSKLGWIASIGGGVAVVTAGLIMSPFTGGATGIAAIGFVSGGIIAGSGVAGGVAGSYVASVVKGDSGNDFVLPSLIEVNSEEFNSLECKQIATKS